MKFPGLSTRQAGLAAFMLAGWTRYDWGDHVCAHNGTISDVMVILRKRGYAWAICDGGSQGGRPRIGYGKYVADLYKKLIRTRSDEEVIKAISARLEITTKAARRYARGLRKASPKPPDWTEEKKAELKRLWDAQNSMSEIAEIMGISKSAVAGQRWRMGLRRSDEDAKRIHRRTNPPRLVRQRNPRVRKPRPTKPKTPPPTYNFNVTAKSAREARLKILFKMAARAVQPEASRQPGGVYAPKFASVSQQ